MLADRATIAHDLAHLAALARGDEKATALAEGHKARGIDSAVDAFVKRTVKETVLKEDGTTEVKALERVNKPHLVQALLALAAAKAGTSVPDKKKLDAMRRASLVQMVFEVAKLDAPQPTIQQGLQRQPATAAAAAATQVATVLANAATLVAAATATAAARGSGSETAPSDTALSELSGEVLLEDDEAAAQCAAADAALGQTSDARLGSDEGGAAEMALAAGEDEAEGQAQEEESIATDQAAVAAMLAATARAATARRKEKKWRCSACGKDHAVFSAVKLLGGGYVCVENCGIVEGARTRKRPLVCDA